MITSMRVGTLNQVLFGGTLLLLAGVIAVDMVSVVSERQATARTVEVSKSGQQLFGALQVVRAERGRVRILLQGQAAAAQSVFDELNRTRQSAGPALQTFLGSCQQISCAGAKDLDEIRAAATTLDGMRRQTDSELAVSLDKRGAGVAERWTKASTALIDLLERLSAGLSTEIRLVDPTIGELVEIKKASFAIRDYSGLARNLYGEALLNKSLTPAQLNKMIDYEGRIDGAWLQLLDLAGRPGEPAAIVEVVKRAKSEYFDHLLPMFMAIRTAAAAGKDGPMAIDEMMKSSSAGLAVLMQVPEAAIAACVGYAEERHAAATRRLIGELAVFLVALVVGLAGIAVIRGRIMRPIDGIVAAMGHVAAGQLDREIPYTDRHDEIGELAAALGVFKANAVEKQRLAEQQRQAQTLREQRQTVIEAAIGEFEAASTGLLDAFSHAATRMTTTSQSMSATAEQTTRQASAVVSASDLTSLNVQTVAGATEELSASIGEISRQVTQSAQIANRAVFEAKRTDGTVNGLSAAASRIGDVIQIIRDIAAQTNLLALNATIEAARAGEAGKGFAVVAGEVKTLAAQTARATDDIAQQIAAIQSVAQESVEAIRGIGNTIGEISGIATAIASAVEEQGAATQDIAHNVQQASQSVQDVSSNIAGVSRAADQTGQAAEDVMQASAEIARQAGDLRQHVATFLARIR